MAYSRNVLGPGQDASVTEFTDLNHEVAEHAFRRIQEVSRTLFALYDKASQNPKAQVVLYRTESQGVRSTEAGWHAAHQSHIANGCITGTENLDFPVQSSCTVLPREINLYVDKQLENHTRQATAEIYSKVLRGEMDCDTAIARVTQLIRNHFEAAAANCRKRIKALETIAACERVVLNTVKLYKRNQELTRDEAKNFDAALAKIRLTQAELKRSAVGVSCLNLPTLVSSILRSHARGCSAKSICKWAQDRETFTDYRTNPEQVKRRRARLVRRHETLELANQQQAAGTQVPKLESQFPKTPIKQKMESARIMQGGGSTPSPSKVAQLRTPIKQKTFANNVTPEPIRPRLMQLSTRLPFSPLKTPKK